jgi:hypothetical protein
MELVFTFSVEEVNYILSALGSKPFAEVQGLISKIKETAENQIAKINSAVPQKDDA